MRKVLVINEVRMALVARELSQEGYLYMCEEIVDGDLYILSPSLSKQSFMEKYPTLKHKQICCAEDYYQEADFELNAIYTAQGTLASLLSLIQVDMNKISIDIIGYGRCGKALYQLLNRLGIQVRVITRQLPEGIYCHGYEHYKASQIMINTQDDICFQLQALAECELIIDIASNQTFADAIVTSSRYHKLRGLPSKFVIKDAAHLLSQAIRRYFNEK